MKAMIQLEDDFHEEPIAELSLALAVVEQALRDLVNRTRRATYKGIKPSYLQLDQTAADDARDFLLHRLWEEGNVWGETLKLYGVQRLTVERLCHGARHMESTYERRRNQRWQRQQQTL